MRTSLLLPSVLLLSLSLTSVSGCTAVVKDCYIPPSLRQPVDNPWVEEGQNLEEQYKNKYKKLETVNIDRKTIQNIYVDSKCDEPL